MAERDENEKPVPKVRKQSIDDSANKTNQPVPKIRSSLLQQPKDQKVRIRKKKNDSDNVSQIMITRQTLNQHPSSSFMISHFGVAFILFTRDPRIRPTSLLSPLRFIR